MAVVFKKQSNAIADAFEALQAEEQRLKLSIESLEKRTVQVRQALDAMRPLLPQTPLPLKPVDAWPSSDSLKATLQRFPYPLESAKEQPEDDEQAVGAGLFEGLQFSQALHKFMLVMPPATTTEIARRFEQAGWKFKNELQTGKVNQVGVTLRRFRGKLFETDAEGLWHALPLNE